MPDRCNWHASFRDRIAAWHRELIDTAVRLTLDTDDLIKLRGVEIDGGWRSRRGRRRERSLARAERIPNNAAIFAGSPWPPTCM